MTRAEIYAALCESLPARWRDDLTPGNPFKRLSAGVAHAIIAERVAPPQPAERDPDAYRLLRNLVTLISWDYREATETDAYKAARAYLSNRLAADETEAPDAPAVVPAGVYTCDTCGDRAGGKNCPYCKLEPNHMRPSYWVAPGGRL